MNKKFLILLCFLLLSFNAESNNTNKLVITTTITPISSLVSMIAGDKVDIATIASTNGCPHHYFLKPSDLKKMENTDLFIYIDEKFDVFANPLLEKFPSKSIKISNIDGINIINNNLHLWLSPKNASSILEQITIILSEFTPKYQAYFQNNLELSLKKIASLNNKKLLLKNLNIVLLSDSAEYIFQGIENIITDYQSEYSSVKSIRKLKKLSTENRCFIISSDQDLSKYQKLLGKKVVSISTENWAIDNDLQSLYYRKYEEIINNIIETCGDN